MYLRDLLIYDELLVQCHNLPDADSIAAAFAVYSYYRAHGKKVGLVYSGDVKISRSNIRLMIEKLNIPLEYIDAGFKFPGLLITVGCMFGAGNVDKIDATDVAVIDNHSGYPPQLVSHSHIKSSFASCSSLIYQMLLSELSTNQRALVQSVISDPMVATALFYGVYMATNEFSDIVNSADSDIRDELDYDRDLFTSLQYSTLSVEELKIVGEALSDYRYDGKTGFAVVSVKTSDPSVLGFVADLMSRVNAVDCCVVYADLGIFYKLSIRSTTREIKPSELIEFLTVDIGEGGGKDRKAGGTIYKEQYLSRYSELEIQSYFLQKFSEFKLSCDCIDAQDYDFDKHRNEFSRYVKKSLILGFVKTEDLIEGDAELILRTYEGNVKVQASADIYIMIGVNGEVYPITKDTFDVSYKECNSENDFSYDYEPRVYNAATGQRKMLKPYIRSCRTMSRLAIWARELTKPTKLFPKIWDYENYMFGLAGDMLVARSDDRKDLYIVKRSIFDITYEHCRELDITSILRQVHPDPERDTIPKS